MITKAYKKQLKYWRVSDFLINRWVPSARSEAPPCTRVLYCDCGGGAIMRCYSDDLASSASFLLLLFWRPGDRTSYCCCFLLTVASICSILAAILFVVWACDLEKCVGVIARIVQNTIYERCVYQSHHRFWEALTRCKSWICHGFYEDFEWFTQVMFWDHCK
jgi:hypothetical protein